MAGIRPSRIKEGWRGGDWPGQHPAPGFHRSRGTPGRRGPASAPSVGTSGVAHTVPGDQQRTRLSDELRHLRPETAKKSRFRRTALRPRPQVCAILDRSSDHIRAPLRALLKDRYGVSWQIVPSVLGEMLQDKDAEKSRRKVWEHCLKWIKMTSKLQSKR